MRAQLKHLHSPDVLDLATYRPVPPNRFGFLLQTMIGPEGNHDVEAFDIMVCTQTWLEKEYGLEEAFDLMLLVEPYGSEEVFIGKQHLIVPEYDYERIVKIIKDYTESCSGDTWEEVVHKLSRLGKNEFEGYSFSY